MVKEYEYFDIKNKVIIERLMFTPPLHKDSSMQDEACLIYNIAGKTEIYSPLQKETMETNECVLLKCGQYFSTTVDKDKSELLDVVGIHFHPDILEMAFADELPKYIPQEADLSEEVLAINKLKVSQFLKNYIDSILFLFQNPSLVTEQLILLKIKEVILILLNTKSDEGNKVRKILSNLFSPDKVSLKKIIDAHCYDNLTLEQLALLCNMSLSTFKRRFTEFFGENPATHIRNRKLEKAAHLLQNSDLSIASICYDVGFTDTSNFSKAFKHHFNLSPSQYRSN